MILLSVFDKKARAFFRPFTSATPATASRELVASLQADAKHPLALYPDDYIVYVIANFDETTGVVSPCEHMPVAIPRKVK